MNIYVGNLPFSFDNGQLSALFAEFGEVTSAQVITDRDTGRSRGFGFVTFQEASAAQNAVNTMNGKTVDGRAIRVDVAQDRQRGGGGGYRGGGGW